MTATPTERQEKKWYTRNSRTGKVAMVDAFAMDGSYDDFQIRNQRFIRWVRRGRDYVVAATLLTFLCMLVYIAATSGIWK